MTNEFVFSRIAVGSDHAGFQLKNQLIQWLSDQGLTPIDCGGYSEESVDYPNIAEATCEKVLSKEADCALLICGTGIGISIAENKIDGIRAALCTDCFSTKYTRLHNDANVICFGARVIAGGLAEELLSIFLKTPFEGGRHQRRVDLITALEQK